MSAVLDPVDGLAVEPCGLGQLLLRQLDPLAQGGYSVAKTRAVLRQAGMDRRHGHGGNVGTRRGACLYQPWYNKDLGRAS
jgi:hypothetical protein